MARMPILSGFDLDSTCARDLFLDRQPAGQLRCRGYTINDIMLNTTCAFQFHNTSSRMIDQRTARQEDIRLSALCFPVSTFRGGSPRILFDVLHLPGIWAALMGVVSPLDHRPSSELQPISGLNLEYRKALERVSDCSAEDWLQHLVARGKHELAGVGANSVQ
jgi:hypothetical protein